MTLRLAAFQHFCARFADAFLTGLSPLTYECGDYLDGTEKLDPDYEPAGCFRRTPEYELRLSAERAAVAATEMAAHLHEYLDLQDSEAVVPTAASASPAPVDGTPPASPGAGLSSIALPMYDAKDLEAVAAEYIGEHGLTCDNPDSRYGCECGNGYSTWEEQSAHVAELVVSAITFELQGLAYDQSHPETQK